MASSPQDGRGHRYDDDVAEPQAQALLGQHGGFAAQEFHIHRYSLAERSAATNLYQRTVATRPLRTNIVDTESGNNLMNVYRKFRRQHPTVRSHSNGVSKATVRYITRCGRALAVCMLFAASLVFTPSHARTLYYVGALEDTKWDSLSWRKDGEIIFAEFTTPTDGDTLKFGFTTNSVFLSPINDITDLDVDEIQFDSHHSNGGSFRLVGNTVDVSAAFPTGVSWRRTSISISMYGRRKAGVSLPRVVTSISMATYQSTRARR